LNSRSLIVPMKCSSRRDLLPVTDPRIVFHTQRLQRRLLQFRLRNYSALSVAAVAGEEDLQPRSRDLLRCLSAPLQEIPGVIEVLHHVFQKQESLREMISTRQAAMTSAVFQASHEYGEGNWLIHFGYLKDVANAWLQLKGEPKIESGHAVGKLLTSLGFTDRQPTNTGTALISSRAMRKLAHDLQRQHKIDSHITQKAVDSCDLCTANKPGSAAAQKATSKEKTPAR
jgi:hypothetical protein